MIKAIKYHVMKYYLGLLVLAFSSIYNIKV